MSALSQPMIQTLINARLNGSACHGKPTARALVNRRLAFIRQGTESDVELTELGVEVAEKLWHNQDRSPIPTATYKDALALEAKKDQQRNEFFSKLRFVLAVGENKKMTEILKYANHF